MIIGKNIKQIRKQKQITQKLVADSLGVSRQAVCMWETGKRDPKASTLNRMAKLFEVSVDEILNGIKDK